QLASKLEDELDGWLSAAALTKSPDVRAVIAPHAGYSYSGRCAAYAFGNIDPTNISRVFLLGPSHHYYTPKCALSRATVYSTPIGDLPVDLEAQNEAMYGQLLAKYVDDPKNFFSVSSDFCHWGSRFSYTYYDKKHGAIHKSIEALDRLGMEIIETGDPDAFKQYLEEYENTICGRHPISVLLHMLKHCSTKIKVGFVRYEQSSQCKTTRDSSVSYASAVAKVDTPGEVGKDWIL
uniref:AmmeMemoRadiSam system protein B n=1 Tax=Aegilops tauschii subsp. strangulata TaxID=200361 RepID=A0A453T941_AEGTS